MCPHCGKTFLARGLFSARRRRERTVSDGPVWRPTQRRTATPSLSLLKNRPAQFILLLMIMLAAGMVLVGRSRKPLPSNDAAMARVARRNLAVLRVAIEQLRAHGGRYPTTREGLVSLVHNPGMPDWQGPYILELKPDPWGRPFGYEAGSGQVRIFCLGPDGESGTADDIAEPPPVDTESVTDGEAYRVTLPRGQGE